MNDEELESTLVTKVAAAQSAGLDVHIVTAVLLRTASDPSLDRDGCVGAAFIFTVDIGFAGPTSLMTWLATRVVAGCEHRPRRSRVEAASSSTRSTQSHPTRSSTRARRSAYRRCLARAQAAHLLFRRPWPDGARWVAGAMQGALTLDKGRRIFGPSHMGHRKRHGAEHSEGTSRHARPWAVARSVVDRRDGEEEHTAALTSTWLRAGIAHSIGSAAACRQMHMADDPDEIPKRQKEFRMRPDS